MGTPSYMAPEQAEGRSKEIGPATDIYALGAILYELLTGRPPFRSAQVLDTLEQVRSQEPVAPSRLQPKVPRDLENVCLKCLQKDPRRRYADAGLLADDLRRYLDGRPVQARSLSAVGRLLKWTRRRPAVAALLASVILVTAAGVAGVVWQWRQTQAELEAPRPTSTRALSLADREWLANHADRAAAPRRMPARTPRLGMALPDATCHASADMLPTGNGGHRLQPRRPLPGGRRHR